jgi:TP901 family phage tail tape measure protein
MPNITIGADTSGAQSGMDQFNQMLINSGKVVGDFVNKTMEYNKANEAFMGVVEQMSSTGQKITRTFEITAQGVEQAGVKVTNTAKAMKQQFLELQAAAARAATADVSKIFPMPSGANIQNVASYTNSITNLQRVFAQSGVSAAQFQQMMTEAKTNMKAFAQTIPSMTPQMQSLARAILGVGSASTQAEQQFTIGWAGIARTVQSMLVRRAISALISLMREGITQAQEFSIKLQQVANVTGQTPGAVRREVTGVSEQYGISPTQAAGLYQQALTSQGGDAAAGVNVLNQAMMLGRATGLEYNAALRLTTASMDAFHLSANDAGRVVNVLAAAQSRSRIPLEQLQASIGRVGPAAKAMGVDFEQVVAAFITIQSQGGRASESMNRIQQVLGAFERPGKAMQQWMQSLGVVNAQSLMNAFGGQLPAVLEKLNQDAERTPELMSEIGGSLRTFIGFLSLGGQNTEKFRLELEKLYNTDPSKLAQNFEKVDQTVGAQWEKFAQRIKNFFAEDIVSGPLKLINMALDSIFNNPQWENAQKIAREGRTAAEQIRAGGRAEVRDYEQKVRQHFEPDLAGARELIKLSNQVRDDAINDHKRMAQSWLITTQSFTDTLRSALSEVRREIAKNTSEIDASMKRAQNFAEQARAALFQERFGAIQDPYQKQVAIQQRMQELQQEQSAIEQKAAAEKRILNDAEISEINKMFQERLKLSIQFFKEEDAGLTQNLQHWTQYLNQIGQQAHDAYAKTLPPGAQMGAYQPIVAKYSPNMTQDQQRQEAINQLIEQQARWEKQIQEARRQRNIELEKEKSIQTQNLKLVEQAFRNIEKFSMFDEKGNMLRRYREAEARQGPGGGRALAAADLEKLAKAARDAIDVANERLPTEKQISSREVSQVVTQKAAALAAETAAVDRANQASSRLLQLEESMKKIIEEGTDAINKRIEAQVQLKLAQTQMGVTLAEIRGRMQKVHDVSEINVGQIPFGSAARQSAEDWNAYVKAQQNAEQALARMSTKEGQTAENALLLRTAMSELMQTLAKLKDASSWGDWVSRIFGGVEFTGNLQTALGNIDREVTNKAINPQRQARIVDDAIQKISTAQSPLEALQQIGQPAQQMRAGFEGAAVAMPHITQELEKSQKLTAQINQDIINTVTSINQMRGLSTPAPGFIGPLEPGQIAPGRYAEGGPVSGPRGTDNIPAWLTAGEFVVNADSTRRFYTQLLSINSGRQPRYFAGGGLVTVGDINVNVSGGDTSERTIREIAQGINTELRRGTVRFQTLQDAQ